MCNGKCCCKGGCMVARFVKLFLIIGGISWGLVGIGMLMNIELNIVHLFFRSVPTLEAIVYLLVGVAAVMKIFNCCCHKCKTNCAGCEASSEDKKM